MSRTNTIRNKTFKLQIKIKGLIEGMKHKEVIWFGNVIHMETPNKRNNLRHRKLKILKILSILGKQKRNLFARHNGISDNVKYCLGFNLRGKKLIFLCLATNFACFWDILYKFNVPIIFPIPSLPAVFLPSISNLPFYNSRQDFSFKAALTYEIDEDFNQNSAK